MIMSNTAQIFKDFNTSTLISNVDPLSPLERLSWQHRVPISWLLAVVDLFDAHAEAEIYVSLGMFIFFAYGCGAPFAAIILDCG